MELKVTTWYLEQLKQNFKPLEDRKELSLQRIDPTLAEYRSLYSRTGKDLAWVDRMVMPDEQLSSIIHRRNIIIVKFMNDGLEMGYGELELQEEGNTEIAYFGLFPESRGKGTGGYFLNKLTQLAFDQGANRVWLHTCELDHPSALGTYQKAGFEVYDRNIILQRIPQGYKMNIRGTQLQYPSDKVDHTRVRLELFNPSRHEEFYSLVYNNHHRLKDYFPRTVDGAKDPESAKIFLDLRLNDWHIGNSFSYFIISKETEKLAGALIIKNIDYKNLRADAGYYLDSSYEGKGMMRDSFSLLIEQARSMNLKTLVLRIEPVNARSKALAYACGFQFEKKVMNDFYTLSGEVLDLEYYTLDLHHS